jgi:hypothetical protein
MHFRGRMQRAKAAAKTILGTLAKHDHVNVVCASGAYKCKCQPPNTGSDGEHNAKLRCPISCSDCPRTTYTLGCIEGEMFPATR